MTAGVRRLGGDGNGDRTAHERARRSVCDGDSPNMA